MAVVKEITKKTEAFLNAELNKMMKDFNAYREKVAREGEKSRDMNAALEEERIWENRICGLKDSYKGARTFVPERQNEIIALGSRVELLYQNGQETIKTVTIDGVGYQNDKVTIINAGTYIGKNLLNKRVGDTIKTKDGKMDIKINKIMMP